MVLQEEAKTEIQRLDQQIQRLQEQRDYLASFFHKTTPPRKYAKTENMIIDYLQTRGGEARFSEISKALVTQGVLTGGPAVQLYRMLKAGSIERIKRGVYKVIQSRTN